MYRIKFLLKYIFVILIVYPVIYIVLGVNVRHRERIPRKGPAIICANHNSHLDIFALLTLFPLGSLPHVRPVAAADYFLSTGLKRWFSNHVIGLIPIMRGGTKQGIDPLEPCYEALEKGEILVIFPEGTRGEPEQMQQLKAGVSFLTKRCPNAPVIPIYMHGLGKSLPKGAIIPVPFFVDMFVGQPLYWQGEKESFMTQLNNRFQKLKAKVKTGALIDEQAEI